MASALLDPNSPFFHEQRHLPLGASADLPLTICGAGALGGNLAETLARMGFTRLTVIDRDRVESRNLSSQPYAMGEVGAPKARALAGGLYRAVRARVEARSVELTEANAAALLSGSALVVDAFDNQAACAAITNAVRTLAVPCLHIGFGGDGLYGSVLWDRGYQVPRPSLGDPCDYPLTRPLALCLAALAARSIVHYMHAGEQQSYELTWADLRIGAPVAMSSMRAFRN